jgi:hypothetical protein
MTSKAGEVVWDAVHVGLLFAERGIARDGAHNRAGLCGKGGNRCRVAGCGQLWRGRRGRASLESMLRRLPLILGLAAGLALLLTLGPIAIAVTLMRSSPAAQGPDLAARIFLAALVLAVAALAGLAVWGLARLLLSLARRGR